MKYICVQPAIKYYTWQLEVMISNFLKMGVNKDDIHIVCLIDKLIPQDYIKLQSYGAKFFFYEDTRMDRSYIPSVYFHGLKKHLQANPELTNERLFLHDSDIVFTKRPTFDNIPDDGKFYLSDTNHYINYDYVISKGEAQFLKMCEIIGLSPEIVRNNNKNSGGAQYLVKGVTYELFDKIENDSNKLYAYLCEMEALWNKDFYAIQKWTSGMWAELWNFWKYGFETVVDERMGFGWVTSPINDVEKYSILHNAGVTVGSAGLFFKGAYINELPYFKNLQIDQSRASAFYYEQILNAERHTVL